MKGNKIWKIDLTLIILLTLFLLSATIIYHKIFTPVSLNTPEKIVNIPEGSGIKTISRSLKSAGLIRNATAFYLLSMVQGKSSLKAGEYNLNPGMTPFEILDILEQGRVVQHKITVPEGFNIYQIANLFGEKDLSDKEVFLTLCSDPNILEYWKIEGSTVEGYLFPETYFFSKGISEKRILDTMIRNFWKIFKPEFVERAKELDFTVHEIVILASLIEKETALPEERPLISAVFHKRLKERIRLQCDPSVIYGLKNFDGNLTKKDLVKLTPYNTYKIRGLPIGPIANPGLGCLEAALYPANVNYKYFVSRNDGSHEFSETLRQHNRAVLKYQKRRTRNL
ncbi:MAG: endolytic transglycosylase MltG [bacterium]